MKPVIQERLLSLAQKKLKRFHYPGHKGRDLHFDPQALGQLDMTETFYTDDLQDPQDIIKRSQAQAARLYGSLDCFYGVGGSTMANYAALGGATQPGDTILVQRNAHKSVYQGAILAQLKVRTLSPRFNEAFSLLLDLDLEDLEEALRTQPKPRVLVLTSPSYQGVFLPLREIVDLAHREGVLVLVDEAHGAHLAFSSQRAYSALEAGADLVVQSAHKSLPALTGTSLLHRNTEAIDRDRLERFFRLFTTTSPSYLMLTSLEGALVAMAQEGEEKLSRLEAQLGPLKEGLRAGGAQVLEAKDLGTACPQLDFTKLSFRVPGYGGEDLLRALYDQGLNLEMAEGSLVTAVLSTQTSLEDLQALVAGVQALAPGKGSWPTSLYRPLDPDPVLDLREAFYREKTRLPLKEALGQVAGDFVLAYPPGVPLLLPGERIKKDHLELLEGAPAIRGLDDKGRIGVIDGDICSF
ncbi:MAG: aminotransferase class I/II-fold pyridoxal phosphate-dependent enzyme [Tissierellia bacterium]|nr:aminotransferase class I/II-fold pyridoxal phosphate-dependent enzyme [Tissierellia bacterium]